MQLSLDEQLDEADRLFHEGKIDDAVQPCRGILGRDPGNPRANILMGNICLMGGDFDGAARHFRTAIASDPGAFEAHKNLGVALVNQNRLGDAVASLRQALVLKPDYAEASYDLGVLFLERGRIPDAIEHLRKAADLKPDFVEARFNLAAALGESGDLEAATANYQKVLQVAPNFVEAHFNLGIALGRLNRHSAAIANFQKVIEAMPDLPEGHFNLGVALRISDYGDAAIKCYKRAIELKPDYAEAHNHLGIAHAAAQRLPDAVASYLRAIELDPDYAEAHCNLGMALDSLRRGSAALVHLRKAVTLRPDYVEAQRALGGLLSRIGRTHEAVEALSKALQGGAADPDLLCDLGQALASNGEVDLAISAYRDALAIDPDHAAAQHSLAEGLTRAGRYEEAIATCDARLVKNPSDVAALDQLNDLLRHACDWRKFEPITQRLVDIVDARWGGVDPFWFLSVTDDPAAQRACAEQMWEKERVPVAPAWHPRPRAAGKLRIGYFSRYLNHHATGYLMAEMLELHDRERFETFAYSFGRDDQSGLRERIKRAVDRFVDVAGECDDTIAARIRDDKIDVLIDLDGYLRRNRLAILAHRPAPVQVQYLGFPGTLGVPFIDYVLVDSFVVPPDRQPHFTERLVHLPDSYQPSDRKRPIAATTPSRAGHGLPDQGFVFCCFNNCYKITPAVFDRWMNMLVAVPGSVLWLLAPLELTQTNLRREAEARGVDPKRLVFGHNLPSPEHLARHRHADLFVDTFAYTAHTTANDALWTGLPVVTCVGKSFATRVAGGLLRAVGLPELVTETPDAYEKLAIDLARDPARLASVRDKLKRNLPTAPLFDTDRRCRSIEAAFLRMWDVFQRGEEPRSFAVE